MSFPLRFASSLAAFLLVASSSMYAKTVTLGMTDNRTDVSLNLGDTLVVELPSGSVNGFSWVVHLPQPSALTALNDETVPAPANQTGAPQLRRFRFNAAIVGDVELTVGFEANAPIPGVTSQNSSAFSVFVHVASGAPKNGMAILFGTYKGTLPCADCSGLETTLFLYAAGMNDTTYAYYVRSQTYRGAPHGDVTFSDRGDWTLLRGDATNENATVYQLNPDSTQRSEYLLVQEKGTALLQLDQQQRRIKTKANLTLQKVP
jgi:predicted secreted protein